MQQINNMLWYEFSHSPVPLNKNSHPLTHIHCAFHNSMPTVDYPLIHSHTDQWCWSPLTAKSAHITHSSSLWSWLQPFFHCFSVGIRQISLWTIRKDNKDRSWVEIHKAHFFLLAFLPHIFYNYLNQLLWNNVLNYVLIWTSVYVLKCGDVIWS